jgi:putative transposase
MDEQYLLAATRYIEQNPVKAGLVSVPEDSPWCSAKAHIEGREDDLVKVNPLLEMVDDWQQFLSTDVSDKECALLQRHERTGRP